MIFELWIFLNKSRTWRLRCYNEWKWQRNWARYGNVIGLINVTKITKRKEGRKLRGICMCDKKMGDLISTVHVPQLQQSTVWAQRPFLHVDEWMMVSRNMDEWGYDTERGCRGKHVDALMIWHHFILYKNVDVIDFSLILTPNHLRGTFGMWRCSLFFEKRNKFCFRTNLVLIFL